MDEFEKIYTFANIFEKVKIDNYNLYNEYSQRNTNENSRNVFFKILNNYLQNIISEKININEITNRIEKFSKRMIEHLTGDYEIGVGNVDFEELTEYAENVSSIVAYSNNDELKGFLSKESLDELANGIIDGVIASNLIPSNYDKKANLNFEMSNKKIKSFFLNSIYNITHINEKVANLIAHIILRKVKNLITI